MKILKLLNKKNLSILISFFFLQNSYSTEPVDIWNLDKQSNQDNSNNDIIENEDLLPSTIFNIQNKYKDKIEKYRKVTGQKTALMCASGNISNLLSVVVCFNPKFGGGRFGPAENEHFLKAANFAIEKKIDILPLFHLLLR